MEDGNFKSPKGIAIDGGGNVWVVDSGNNRIQEFSSTGTFLAKLGPRPRPWRCLIPATSHRLRRHLLGGRHEQQRDQALHAGGAYLSSSERRARKRPIRASARDRDRLDRPDPGHRLEQHRVQVFEDKNGPDTTITGPAASTPSSSASFTLRPTSRARPSIARSTAEAMPRVEREDLYSLTHRRVPTSSTPMRRTRSASTGTRPNTRGRSIRRRRRRASPRNPRRRPALRLHPSRSHRTKAARRSCAPGTPSRT